MSETALQQLFKNRELLTSRPEGMDYDVYKYLLMMQNYVIKKATASKPSRNIPLPLNHGYNYHTSESRRKKFTEEDTRDNQDVRE